MDHLANMGFGVQDGGINFESYIKQLNTALDFRNSHQTTFLMLVQSYPWKFDKKFGGELEEHLGKIRLREDFFDALKIVYSGNSEQNLMSKLFGRNDNNNINK